ncbi:alternative NAD(P)H dehydrogenase [Parasponia andersonii]|uniref:Alternative NAD(P)H dehydrogenase n=1 Tax=Parasponia andersonii TaxID=3476 RepID=A0A2P5C8Y8_PARAD|nr:alternative NAD(P)H dehydrogenase [Parasponia andersonii]
MGFGTRLCLCLLLSYALLLCSARNTLILSAAVTSDIGCGGGGSEMRASPAGSRVPGDEEMVLGMKHGRSLRVSTNDYDQPTANRGHDPAPSSSSSRGKGGGRRRG